MFSYSSMVCSAFAISTTKRVESRLADQLASLLSCFWLYFSTEVITESNLDYFVQEFELLKSEYVMANETNDAEECYDALMTMKVDNMNNSVYQCIHEIQYAASSVVSDQWEKILGAMGMRYYPAKKRAFNCRPIRRVKKKTSWIQRLFQHSQKR